jgi:hypothetical protein
MAVLGNSCFYWSISKTAFPLKPLGQMIANQKQESTVVAMFVADRDE